MNHTATLLTCLLLSSTFAVADAPNPSRTGSHIVAHVEVDQPNYGRTTVFAVVGEDGDVVAKVEELNNRFYITDGDGWIATDRLVGVQGHRIDVLLHGATYTIWFDQTDSFTAATMTDAQAGRAHPAPNTLGGSGTSTMTRDRIDDDGLRHDTTFTSDPETWGWKHVENDPLFSGAVNHEPDRYGHDSAGFIELAGISTGVNYLQAPLPGGDYLAVASAARSNAPNADPSAAVLAAISGPPEMPRVDWAVVFDWAESSLTEFAPIPETGTEAVVDEHALFFVSGDQRVRLTEPSFGFSWYGVQVEVDRAAGTVEVLVDGEAGGTFQPATMDADRIGVGDVFASVLERNPLGTGTRYDDVAVVSR